MAKRKKSGNVAGGLEQIDENLLNQVCLEQWDESATLEFKAMLPQSVACITPLILPANCAAWVRADALSVDDDLLTTETWCAAR